ncbi:MAG: iron chelate uptake ABC transporter family permease subunit [Candidatus Dadabacteria bacterium]|nr:iron chelate uptake ABC transporter family permease subunit [Candidatus Dadabacteria bacterium]
MPTGKKTLSVYAILAFLLLLTIVACASLGAVSVPFDEVLRIIAGKLLWLDAGGEIEKTYELIVWDVRLPRVLLAATIGGGLSIAGAVMQAMFRNPMAETDLHRCLSAVVFPAPACRLRGHPSYGICGLQNIPLQGFCREHDASSLRSGARNTFCLSDDFRALHIKRMVHERNAFLDNGRS